MKTRANWSRSSSAPVPSGCVGSIRTTITMAPARRRPVPRLRRSDQQPMEPGLESDRGRGVREDPATMDEGLLDRVLGDVGVAQDEAGDAMQMVADSRSRGDRMPLVPVLCRTLQTRTSSPIPRLRSSIAGMGRQSPYECERRAESFRIGSGAASISRRRPRGSSVPRGRSGVAVSCGSRRRRWCRW